MREHESSTATYQDPPGFERFIPDGDDKIVCIFWIFDEDGDFIGSGYAVNVSQLKRDVEGMRNLTVGKLVPLNQAYRRYNGTAWKKPFKGSRPIQEIIDEWSGKKKNERKYLVNIPM